MSGQENSLRVFHVQNARMPGFGVAKAAKARAKNIVAANAAMKGTN
jgi:hypothetical protein